MNLALFFRIYADTDLRDGRIIIAIFTVLAVLFCLGSVRLLRRARFARSLGRVHSRKLYLANGEEAPAEDLPNLPHCKASVCAGAGSPLFVARDRGTADRWPNDGLPRDGPGTALEDLWRQCSLGA